MFADASYDEQPTIYAANVNHDVESGYYGSDHRHESTATGCRTASESCFPESAVSGDVVSSLTFADYPLTNISLFSTT